MSLQDKIAIRPSELKDAEELFAMVKESIESTYPYYGCGWQCENGLIM